MICTSCNKQDDVNPVSQIHQDVCQPFGAIEHNVQVVWEFMQLFLGVIIWIRRMCSNFMTGYGVQWYLEEDLICSLLYCCLCTYSKVQFDSINIWFIQDFGCLRLLSCNLDFHLIVICKASAVKQLDLYEPFVACTTYSGRSSSQAKVNCLFCVIRFTQLDNQSCSAIFPQSSQFQLWQLACFSKVGT